MPILTAETQHDTGNNTAFLQPLTVSVIIPTKNRPHALRETLRTVLAQTKLPDETIVIDQSDEPCQLDARTVPLRYIHSPAIPTLPFARNVGMSLASGDVLLFLDDDVILEHTFLECLLNEYRPGISGVSGIITNYARRGRLKRFMTRVFYRGPFDDTRQDVYERADQLSGAVPVHTFTGALMSFRAQSIIGLHFNERLDAGTRCDDMDFCSRLPKGSVLLVACEARLRHLRNPRGRSFRHWLAEEAQTAAYMHWMYWNGPLNTLRFLWLNLGFCLAALASCAKHRSLDPIRGWLNGMSQGFATAEASECWRSDQRAAQKE